MKYFICSNKSFINILNNINPDKTAVILCSSYELNTEKLKNFHNKLILYFDDICAIRANSFNSKIADEIYIFVDSIKNSVDDIYVCCDSGESRSSAICASIMRYMHDDEMQIWKNPYYHPNILVYKILCDKLGIKASKIALKYKKYINKRAFSNEIKRNSKMR